MNNPFYKLLETFDQLDEGPTQKIKKIGNNIEVDDGQGNKVQYDADTWKEMQDVDESAITVEEEVIDEEKLDEILPALAGIAGRALATGVAKKAATSVPGLAGSVAGAVGDVAGKVGDVAGKALNNLVDPGSGNEIGETDDFEPADAEVDDKMFSDPDYSADYDSGGWGDELGDDDIGMDFSFEDADKIPVKTIMDATAEEEEWSMAMGHDQDDEEEMIGYSDDEWDDVEYLPFNADEQGRRLRAGTPVIFSDSIGGGNGTFIAKSPSGFFGTAERNGKTISIHLSDIEQADLTNEAIYENFENNFDKLMEEVTVTKTSNAEDPENNTITITGTGEHADQLGDMMKLAGMNSDVTPEIPQDAEIAVVDTPAPSLGDMIGIMDEPVEEGFGDTMKKGAKKAGKWMKRGMQGWDFDYGYPKDMQASHSEYDTDTLKGLEDKPDQKIKGSDHSPAGLQQKLINRELRRRGERDFKKYGDSRKMTDDIEEDYANEPNDATELAADVDGMVNGHSGGLNRQKNQYRKEYPGDNHITANLEESSDKYSVYNTETNEIVEAGMTRAAAKKKAEGNENYSSGTSAWVEDKCRATNESVDSFLNLYKQFKIINNAS